MTCLLDANILLRLAEPGHRQHRLAMNAVTTISMERKCVIVPQSLYEFWSVASRPLEANGLGLRRDTIDEQLCDFQKIFYLAKDERSVYDIWRGLMREYRVTGPRVHDARYVAAMLRHRISHLLTFNLKDFGQYEGIAVVSPKTMST